MAPGADASGSLICMRSGRCRRGIRTIPLAGRGSRKSSRNAGWQRELRSPESQKLGRARVDAASGSHDFGNTRFAMRTTTRGTSITFITTRLSMATSTVPTNGRTPVSTAGSEPTFCPGTGRAGMMLSGCWSFRRLWTRSESDAVGCFACSMNFREGSGRA